MKTRLRVHPVEVHPTEPLCVNCVRALAIVLFDREADEGATWADADGWERSMFLRRAEAQMMAEQARGNALTEES